MNRLNTFAHFQSKKEHHEDVLTRAFLYLVRLIPQLHEMFLTLIQQQRDDQLPSLPALQALQALGEPSIQTQTSAIESDVQRLISVLLTDEKLDREIPVRSSDRAPKYDGVLLYPPDWGIIIENKPFHKSVWDEQLCPNLSRVEVSYLESPAIVIEWKEIVRTCGYLTEDKSLDLTAKKLLYDFLDYVFESFAWLNPYDRFSLCRHNLILLENRCWDLMEEILPGRVREHRNWHDSMSFGDEHAANQIALCPIEDQPGIHILIYPGDTVSQGKKLYAGLDPSAFLGLENDGWQLSSNFHLAFMSKNEVYFEPTVSLEEYVQFWIRQAAQDLIMQVPTDSEEACSLSSDLWMRHGLISEDDAEAFRDKFLHTNRSTANVCPGVGLQYTWPIDLAESLDDQRDFVQAAKVKIKQALATWGQQVPW